MFLTWQRVLSYFDRASSRLFGHEISQVILLHDNALNADSLDQLIAMLQSRGYRFVTLAEALEDPAYGTPDNYLGSDGFFLPSALGPGGEHAHGAASRGIVND